MSTKQPSFGSLTVICISKQNELVDVLANLDKKAHRCYRGGLPWLERKP